ncbi:MAG: nickel-dependent hydrogenase large subunit [Chloroflexi bacterium]|nr:nickel-dependent hydrogenase large subunit [Chloroflexota bacterium]
MPRMVIDPVTRVGGQLRLEAQVEAGAVRDAWLSGTMYRGVERILVGRDPREAWLLAQRICGTCGTAHALASVRAVEGALGIRVPRNARLLRNLVAGTQLVANHVAAFFQRQLLDWVDVAAAVRADPAGAVDFARSLGVAELPGVDAFEAVRKRLEASVESGGGPFSGGPWGHPAYRLSPAADLVLLSHAFAALEWRRRFTSIQTLIGGKTPHPQSFLVGGMATAPGWGGPSDVAPGQHLWGTGRKVPSALGTARLDAIRALVDEAAVFAEEVFLPDAIAVASAHPEWAAVGRGRRHFLAFGDLPEDDAERPALLLPRGRVMDGDVSRLVEVDQSGVGESVDHAWYEPTEEPLRRPRDRGSAPRYDGPRGRFTTLEGAERYSWVKAPRYEDDPIEVGPLARVLVATAAGEGDVPLRFQRAMALTGGPADAAFGTLGRLVAPAVEAVVVARAMRGWLDDLEANLADGDLAVADVSLWDPASWPAAAEGWSIGESGRGAVGHWLAIHGGRIERYTVVDAGTWNASPRDNRGRRGAIEEALVGTPVEDPERPIEILRVVHAFDPCLTCGVH